MVVEETVGRDVPVSYSWKIKCKSVLWKPLTKILKKLVPVFREDESLDISHWTFPLVKNQEKLRPLNCYRNCWKLLDKAASVEWNDIRFLFSFFSLLRRLSVMHSLRLHCKFSCPNVLVHPKCSVSPTFQEFFVIYTFRGNWKVVNFFSIQCCESCAWVGMSKMIWVVNLKML